MGLLRTGLLCLTFGLMFGVFAQDDWEKAAELRQAGEAVKAEKLLKDYESPAGFESLNSTDKIRFLRGLLELAHLKALRDDTTGALSLLNWAESRTDDYQRSIACIKYGEILLDMGEFERAGAYLKNADEIINKRVTAADTGAAIGQGGQQVDTGAAWRELRDQSDLLKAEVESEEMKAKFGATYGSYVKLRRLQKLVKRSNTPRYRNEALKVADEIIETDPASQFAAAAGYLKGEIMASRLTEQSPKKAIADVKTYLNNFVKERPDGLYRGEALMLLGKISLEIEWNAKEAEKYYTQALNYFRKAREKRDALSLYAAISDDLKNQSQPTQKPTSLNEWKRMVYHDEDPLKLYNIGNAPLWYIDDKEKNCFYVLGFIAFVDGNYSESKKYWGNIKKLDSDIASMDSRLPNVSTRLLASADVSSMLFNHAEKKGVSGASLLKLSYAEYLFLLERFDQAIAVFDDVFSSTNDLTTQAISMLGKAYVIDTKGRDNNFKDSALTCYKWVLSKDKLKYTPIYVNAYIGKISCIMGIGGGHKDAQPLLEEYFKNPKLVNNGRDDFYDRSVWYICMCYLIEKEYEKARRTYVEYTKGRSQDSVYCQGIKEYFDNIEKYGTPWPISK